MGCRSLVLLLVVFLCFSALALATECTSTAVSNTFSSANDVYMLSWFEEAQSFTVATSTSICAVHVKLYENLVEGKGKWDGYVRYNITRNTGNGPTGAVVASGEPPLASVAITNSTSDCGGYSSCLDVMFKIGKVNLDAGAYFLSLVATRHGLATDVDIYWIVQLNKSPPAPGMWARARSNDTNAWFKDGFGATAWMQLCGC